MATLDPKTTSTRQAVDAQTRALVKQADEALYAAKSAGRDQVVQGQPPLVPPLVPAVV
ncbi:hypothetical protein [Roseateles saccharophilus]|uniref:hypothetical protein n=1 Tax=Roseateles saccharophilus TaxID=304 RepID=UPI001404B884|nr:hypothetical protein [Roseateles saccharophilus]